MGKVAFVFPGQASQYAGMGKELAEQYPAARAVFSEADQTLGFSISKMCFAGTEEDLKLTANTQPAMLTCSVGVVRVLAEKGLVPDFVAGHSLGEYSALVAAGALKCADAVQLVRKRGASRQAAARAAGDQRGCGHNCVRRRSARSADPAGHHAGALGRVGAAVDR